MHSLQTRGGERDASLSNREAHNSHRNYVYLFSIYLSKHSCVQFGKVGSLLRGKCSTLVNSSISSHGPRQCLQSRREKWATVNVPRGPCVPNLSDVIFPMSSAAQPTPPSSICIHLDYSLFCLRACRQASVWSWSWCCGCAFFLRSDTSPW